MSESDLSKDEERGPPPVVFAFSAREFWVVNVVVFLASTGFLSYGIFFKDHNPIILGSIFFCYLILRFLIKNRPPKRVTVDLLTNEILIDARFPDKSETVSIPQLLNATCEVKPHRFPMTEFTLLLKSGVKKTYYFEVEIKSKGFFSLPKEVPDKKVNELVLLINNSINLQRGK